MSNQSENKDVTIVSCNLTDRMAAQDEAVAKLSTAIDVEAELQRLFAAIRRDEPVHIKHVLVTTDGEPMITPEQLEENMARLFPQRKGPNMLDILQAQDMPDCFGLSRWPAHTEESGSMHETCGADSMSLGLLLQALRQGSVTHLTLSDDGYHNRRLAGLLGHPDGYVGYGEGGLLDTIKNGGDAKVVWLTGPDGEQLDRITPRYHTQGVVLSGDEETEK